MVALPRRGKALFSIQLYLFRLMKLESITLHHVVMQFDKISDSFFNLLCELKHLRKITSNISPRLF